MEREGSVPCSQELSQIHTVHTFPTFSSNIHRNMIHLRLCLPSGLFLSSFSPKISYEYLISPMRAIFLTHLILLDHVLKQFNICTAG